MTGEEARDKTVAAELALADECLAEARYALQGGFHRLVRIRCYYACFHAATAVFAQMGLAFRKHSGLLSAIDTQLVRPGKLPSEYTAIIRRLHESRLRSDYGDAAPVSASDAQQSLADAERVVTMLRRLLTGP
ncbi:MAG: HEPN domain-containing protein [Pirellulales bacterium]|jgi:uncharacterized protein (UPF0332 family)